MSVVEALLVQGMLKTTQADGRWTAFTLAARVIGKGPRNTMHIFSMGRMNCLESCVLS